MKKISKSTIGILALQGDFEAHRQQLLKIGSTPVLVKLPAQLASIDALILPGGESTTMTKLMDTFALRQPIKEFTKRGPIFGTCAGMILLAKKIIDNQAGVKPLDLMDIDVIRNGYGRQVYSFDTELTANFDQEKRILNGSFIRAPKITRIGEAVKILAEFDHDPVLISEGNILAASFHAELSDTTDLLEYFLSKFL